VVLSTAAVILPRLKDFHNLLLDPPHVSLCLNSVMIVCASVNMVYRMEYGFYIYILHYCLKFISLHEPHIVKRCCALKY
jgi:hypothetical protein